MLNPIHLAITPEAAAARPGDRLVLTALLHNAGPVVDRYHLTVSGVPAAWFTLDTPVVSLFPGAGEQVGLTVHPPAGLATGAGVYPITLTATSEDDPTLRVSTVFTLTVSTVGTLRLEVQPAAATGRKASYRVTIQNRANTPARLDLLARDAEDKLDFRMEPEEQLTVPPDGQRLVTARVRPQARVWLGEPHRYEIEFRGLPEGVSPTSKPDPLLVGRATLTVPPRFRARRLPSWLRRLPRWALLVGLLGLLGLLILGFATGIPLVRGSGSPQVAATPVVTAPAPLTATPAFTRITPPIVRYSPTAVLANQPPPERPAGTSTIRPMTPPPSAGAPVLHPVATSTRTRAQEPSATSIPSGTRTGTATTQPTAPRPVASLTPTAATGSPPRTYGVAGPQISPTVKPTRSLAPTSTATRKIGAPALPFTPVPTITSTPTTQGAAKPPAGTPTPARRAPQGGGPVTRQATSTPSVSDTPDTRSRPADRGGTFMPTGTPSATIVVPTSTLTPLPTATNTAVIQVGTDRHNSPHTATSTQTAMPLAPTSTVTPTATGTTTPVVPTSTLTASPTKVIPTHTQTPTPTGTSSPIGRITPESRIVTDTPTPTSTSTPTGTVSPMPTGTGTPTWTATPTPTYSPTGTATPTPTGTDTPTETITSTPTGTDSPTGTATPTPTGTDTPTETFTSTPTATDTPLPSAHTSPSSVDFGTAQDPPQSVALWNDGPGPLAVDSATLSNTLNFAISADTCSGNTLDPMVSCTVQVAFKGCNGAPACTIAYSGTLEFSDNATNSPQSVALSGHLSPATTTELTTPSNLVVHGFPLTVTVTSSAGTPTGSVTFYDGDPAAGGIVLGTASLSGGVATIDAVGQAQGPHTYFAVYGGDGTFAGSTSTGVSVTVSVG